MPQTDYLANRDQTPATRDSAAPVTGVSDRWVKVVQYDPDTGLPITGGGGGSGTEYTEGVDVVAGGEGTLVLAQDPADGDKGKALNIDAAGNLLVNVAAGGTAGGATESTLLDVLIELELHTASLDLLDDCVRVDDAGPVPVASKGLMMMAWCEDGSNLLDNGDSGLLRCTNYRALHVQLRNNAGNSVGDAVAIKCGGFDADDAPLTVAPIIMGGRARATVPADVSADEDAVPTWHLLSGALVTQISHAGALVSPATETSLSALLTELQLKADLTETQPVSLAAVPAPLNVVGGGTEAAALRVTLANDSTGLVSVDDNGGSLTVDGAVTVSGTVTADTELPAAGALSDNMANPTTPLIGACALAWDGSTWDRIQISAAGVTVNTEMPAAAALADNAANPTAPAVGAFNMLWDGSTWDRAPGTSAGGATVSPIVGQSGVQGASGVVTALTQRVVLATDVGLPAGTANIGDVDIVSTPGATLSVTCGDQVASVATPVTGTALSSDTAWTLLIENTLTAHILEIQNTTDAPLEIAINDSPTGSDGASISSWIGPRTLKVIDLKAAGLVTTADVHVRRATTTPVTGYVYGTVYGV